MNENNAQVKSEQFIDYKLIETLRLTKFLKSKEIILYGTAGFRIRYLKIFINANCENNLLCLFCSNYVIFRAELLDHVAFTMGVLSVLRSKKKNGNVIYYFIKYNIYRQMKYAR